MKAVITTINYPTEAVKEVAKRCGLIVVGDKKTPRDWSYSGVEYINECYEYSVIKFISDNHYARKNIGYLRAIESGAECIYDTDDDNIPNTAWGIRRHNTGEVYIYDTGGWKNVYQLFVRQNIWPRGYPLKQIRENSTSRISWLEANSSIQQGLADLDPDVDAIWRMMNGWQVVFDKKQSVLLHPGTWCPFNSQSTWWFPKAYPLMYLPVTATMRMTDIWRSFVAQRCLWEIGEGVTFHSPSEVFQKRNEHDLLKDFEDEVPGYLKNEKIVEVLCNLKLKQGVEYICDNLYTCYKELENAGIYQTWETRSVSAWIKDIKEIWKP